MNSDRGNKPSASSAERWINCSASHLRSLSEPRESSEQADKGTFLHKCCETFFTDRNVFDFYKKSLTKEESFAVEFCINRVLEISSSEDFFAKEYEKRLWDNAESFSGQPDVLLVSDKQAVVIDYKFGRGKVATATGNWQLATLAVLAKENYRNVEEVDCYIVQPFAEERVSSVRYSLGHLLGAKEIIDSAVFNCTMHPQEKFGSWCSYCPYAVKCKSANTEISKFDCYDITPANACDTFKKIKTLRAILDSMEAKIKTLAEQQEIKGLRWSNGATRLIFKNANATYGFFSQIIGAEDFITCVDVNKSKLQNLYVQKLQSVEPSRSRADIEREFNRTIIECGLVEQVQNKPTLKIEN